VTTILVLSILVLLHELGHFLVAKLFGIKVEEFGIGLPPKAVKLGMWGETEFSLNWLPIGGFVRLAGEEEDPSLWEKINPMLRKKLFFAKPAWQRALVTVAGVAMNLVLGILAFSVVYTRLGVPKEVGQQVMVSQVIAGSPAEAAGVTVGVVVVRVKGEQIEDADKFVEIIKQNKGQMISLYLATVDANGERSESETVVNVIPRENPPEGEGSLGVGVVDVPIIVYEQKAWYSAPFYGANEGMKEAWGWTKEFGRILAHPVELVKNVSGPVKVVQIGQQAADQGWIVLVRFAGIISLNLAIFNLLPIPALDGGRLLLIGLEKVVGRKRIARVEKYVNAVGMALLILLLITVTIKDIFWG